MLDGRLKPKIDPMLTAIGDWLARKRVRADHITLFGLALGLIAACLITMGWFWAGLVFIVASRLCDGLDGAVARATKPTDFGGYLDIVLDFVFYGAIPLAFILYDPHANGVAGAVLIFSFYVNGASFLAFAIMAQKHGLTTDQRGQKSFFFSTGLAEATETYAVFVAFCLVPTWFAPLAWGFAAICFYTAISRIVMTAQILK